MLSTRLAAKTWGKTPHAARRLAARIASAFVPKAHLAPLTCEALCYGCMAGIVMTMHATCEADTRRSMRNRMTHAGLRATVMNSKVQGI